MLKDNSCHRAFSDQEGGAAKEATEGDRTWATEIKNTGNNLCNVTLQLENIPKINASRPSEWAREMKAHRMKKQNYDKTGANIVTIASVFWSWI